MQFSRRLKLIFQHHSINEAIEEDHQKNNYNYYKINERSFIFLHIFATEI